MRKILNIREILNKKVISIRGFRSDKRRKRIPPQFILFGDRKTYMVLDEQDYYTCHDCNSSARVISVYQNKDEWKRIFKDKDFYPESTFGIE